MWTNIANDLILQGLTLAIVGPTLLDISELLKISVAQMSYVAFSGDFGAFVGSFLGEHDASDASDDLSISFLVHTYRHSAQL